MIVTSSRGRPDTSGIFKKIVEIRENRIVRFEPLIKAGEGLTYTGFSDRDFAMQLDILRTLQAMEIVREEPFDYIRKCSQCGYHGMLVKVSCPACGSTNTEQGRVVEHLPCGNIELESKFQTPEGALVCPKCKKKLKAIGVDYVKPGSYCACLSCKTLSPEGRMQFVCLNCASSLGREEMKLESLAAYVVDHEAVARYLDKTGLQFHVSVVEALRSLGISAAANATITGSSRVEHIFDIVCYFGDGQTPAVAADIEKSEGAAGPEPLLNFLARCLDCRIAKKIFICIPGFSDEARRLGEAHGIDLVESTGSDAEQIAGRIAGGMPEEPVTQGQIEEMIESVSEAVQDSEEPESAPESSDTASLERMLRTIISPSPDEEQAGEGA